MQEYHTGYNMYPYIFIQFSHDDADRVMPTIRKLKAKNYNIVFDDNFEIEDKKRYLNVQQITQASSFILFYSRSAARSRLIKETVRFAVPIFNLGKYCICLDDTKFGFSFSDIKNNYTVIEETDIHTLMDMLYKKLSMYILPDGVSPYGTLDELVESADPSLTVPSDAASDQSDPLPFFADYENSSQSNSLDYIYKDILEEMVTQDNKTPFFEKSKQFAEFLKAESETDDSQNGRIQADSPEAFPDFEMSDEFGDDDEFDIPMLSDDDEEPSEPLPGSRESVVELEEIEMPEEFDLTEQPLPKPEPAAENVDAESEILWNALRKKMHVRALKNTRLFVRPQPVEPPLTNASVPDDADYQQDDTIESITIEYPTDEEVSDYIKKNLKTIIWGTIIN